MQLDASGRVPRQISHIEQDGGFFVASVVGNDEVACWHKDAEGAEHRAILRTNGQTITAARVGRNGNVILSGSWPRLSWEGGAEPLLLTTRRSATGRSPHSNGCSVATHA